MAFYFDPTRKTSNPYAPSAPPETAKAGQSAKAQEASGENLKIDGNTVTMVDKKEGIFSFDKSTGLLSVKPNADSDGRVPTSEQAEKFLSAVENKFGYDSEFSSGLAHSVNTLYARPVESYSESAQGPAALLNDLRAHIRDGDLEKGTIRYKKMENGKKYIVEEDTKTGEQRIVSDTSYEVKDYASTGKNKAGEEVFKWVSRENPIEKLMREQEENMRKGFENHLFD